jgi:hypothetical protein
MDDRIGDEYQQRTTIPFEEGWTWRFGRRIPYYIEGTIA